MHHHSIAILSGYGPGRKLLFLLGMKEVDSRDGGMRRVSRLCMDIVSLSVFFRPMKLNVVAACMWLALCCADLSQAADLPGIPGLPMPGRATPGPGLESRRYRLTLLNAAAAVSAGGGDPVSAAANSSERKFVTAYYAVLHESREGIHRDPPAIYLEALRRCGFSFPDGTGVLLILLDNSLVVTHTPKTLHQIERYLGIRRP